MAVIVKSALVTVGPGVHSIVDRLYFRACITNAGKHFYEVAKAVVYGVVECGAVVVVLENVRGETVFVMVYIYIPEC